MTIIARIARRSAFALLCVPALVLATTTAAAAASTAPATGVPPYRHVLFHDSFNSSDDKNWAFHNRSGEIGSGRLRLDGDYLPGAMGRDGWALTHPGDHGWRDYSLSVAYNSSNVGGFPAEVHMAMVFFRTEKAGTTGRDTTYQAMIWDPGQPDPRNNGATVLRHGLVQLFRYAGGTAVVVAETTRSNTRVGANNVTVVAVGATFQVWANGERVLRYVDPKPLRYGGVGVGQIWETNGSFTSVTVRRV